MDSSPGIRAWRDRANILAVRHLICGQYRDCRGLRSPGIGRRRVRYSMGLPTVKRWLILSAVLIGLLSPAAAFWQSRDSNYNVAISTVAYQGPGDVVSGATAWGSCARVYNASKASTSTSLCDLVAVTGGAVVCTLRGTASGFVDLAVFCIVPARRRQRLAPPHLVEAARQRRSTTRQAMDSTSSKRLWRTCRD